MNRRLVTLALAALVAVVACQKQQTGTALGTAYAQIARPAIWRVLPRTQAESLGLEPGDVILADILANTTKQLTVMTQSLSELRKSYGTIVAVDSISFAVGRNDETLIELAQWTDI